MSTRPPRLPVLAIGLVALVAVGCGGAQDADSPTLEGDVAASVSEIADDASSTQPATTSEEPSPSEEPAADEESPDQSTPADPTEAATTDEPTDDGGTADSGSACSVAADEAAIEVARPAPGATVDPTFRLAGCGNTFEATYLWEVELDDGTIAGSGFGTMTCGTGCVGTFDEEIEVTGSGDAVLRVFEEDAADGGRVNVVEVPITVGS